MKRKNNKPEEDLQCRIFEWYCKRYPKLVKLFHGNLQAGLFIGSVRTDRQGNKQFIKNYSILTRIKKSGASSDFPDIQICIPKNGFCGFFLELKTKENSPILKDGSYSTAEKFKGQLEYGLALQQSGYFWDFGIGFAHSINLIEKYMDGEIFRDEKCIHSDNEYGS